MSSSKDYYSILGVDRKASKDEITRAYRKAAMRYHPDRQQGKSDAEKKEAEERFKECSEAASVLTDDEKRARYDRFGSDGFNNSGSGGNGFDPFDYFRKMHAGFGMGGFDDMFGGGFGFGDFGFGNREANRGRRDPDAPVDGRDFQVVVHIDFAMSLYGGTSEISVNVDNSCNECFGTGAKGGEMKPCHVCGGSGMEMARSGIMVSMSTCRNCRGTGSEPSEKCPRCNGTGSSIRKIRVVVPRGIETGTPLSVSGEGCKGRNGGKNGNLIVVLDVVESNLYKRHGMDLSTVLPISPLTASVGGTVEVETPWGKEAVSIPPGSKNGDRIRIKGHGVRKDDSSGDLIVVFVLSPLVGLSKEQEEKLKTLAESLSDKNVASLVEMNKEKIEFRRCSK